MSAGSKQRSQLFVGAIQLLKERIKGAFSMFDTVRRELYTGDRGGSLEVVVGAAPSASSANLFLVDF